MKNHIVNHFNAVNLAMIAVFGESNFLPSLTVPDMTLGLRDLLERYVRGEHVSTFQPVYSDDPDVPDNLETLSPMDRIDMSRDLKAGIAKFQAGKAADKVVDRFAEVRAQSGPVESHPDPEM